MKSTPAVLLLALSPALLLGACSTQEPDGAAPGQTAAPAPDGVLLYTRTAGFRHPSIPDGVAAMTELATAAGFVVEHSEEPALFTDENLARYAAVVFLSTTQDVLDDAQQAAFERWVEGGGGYVGVHAATDTEYDWPWYTRMVGGQFDSHPHIQDAVVVRQDAQHPSTAFLPERWERRDEWYNFKQLNPDVHVLLTLDETSYEGGTNGDWHPEAWCHEVGEGRSWYTAGGHTPESFSEPAFRRHLLEGLKWAARR